MAISLTSSPTTIISHKPSRFIMMAALILALVAPLPYVILKPSTPEDVMGKLITISGVPTYSTSKGSELFITAVLVTDPGTYVSGLQVLASWIDGKSAVFPRAEIYPPNQSDKQISENNQADMTNSQQEATAAALSYLNYDFQENSIVNGTLKNSDATNRLIPGDQIVSVDNQSISTTTQIRAIIATHAMGDIVPVKVKRKINGVEQEVSQLIKLTPNQSGKPALGIFVKTEFQFPFSVKFNIQETGGPSGGMIFALGIIEKLTSEDLLRSRKIAGTGTIDSAGSVGAIGGINEKMIGAAKAGATIFIAPRANCVDIKHTPKNLLVIPVATLTEAVTALRSSHPEALAGCR